MSNAMKEVLKLCGEKIIEMVPAMYNLVTRFMEVDEKLEDLHGKLEEVKTTETDMEKQLKAAEREPGKKRKRTVAVFLDQVQQLKTDAAETINRCNVAGHRKKVKRMRHVPQIERCIRKGQDLLTKAEQLKDQGLTNDEVCTRGDRLAVGEMIGGTTKGHLKETFDFLCQDEEGDKCVGIYGSVGTGKTFIMKHLYNKVFDDKQRFKAVFWASAPKDPSCNKSLQESVAEAMWFKLDDHDEVRRASLLNARFNDIAPEGGPGRIVFFLDNVREEFNAYELLGIPCLTTTRDTSAAITTTTNNNQHRLGCTFVFTAPSQDVCNRMRCDKMLKMDLLTEQEALELFYHEADKIIFPEEAKQVVGQCARMPLAIILIARSMAGVEDIREWRNRIEELMGTINNIHNEEDKILELLKFNYTCLKHHQFVQRCFLASTTLFTNDETLVPREDLIQYWKDNQLICYTHSDAHDQGCTIINMLERTCLLEFVPTKGVLLVRMNKWIRKMANTMTAPI